MNSSIFDNVDVVVAGYAAFMAILISLLMTFRERNKQRAKGLPLSSWLTVLPDTLLGTLVGVGLALTIPPHAAMFNNVTGIAFLSGFGGVVGPKLWDLISSDGLRIGLKAIASYAVGPLKNLASAAEEVASKPPDSPSPNPTVILPPPSAPVPAQEVGEHDGPTPEPTDSFSQPSSIEVLPDEDSK